MSPDSAIRRELLIGEIWLELGECGSECGRTAGDFTQALFARGIGEDERLKRGVRPAGDMHRDDVGGHAGFREAEARDSRQVIFRLLDPAINEIAERVEDRRALVDLDALETMGMRAEDGFAAEIDAAVREINLIRPYLGRALLAPVKVGNREVDL